jgi:putative MATE family efflux protein
MQKEGQPQAQVDDNTRRLGTDPIGKLLFRLSLPSVVSMVAISLYNLINTFWVSRLGYQAVAAVTVVMPFFVFCIAIGVGTGVGVNALASRRFGERDHEGANHAAGQTVFLALLLGTAALLLTNLLPRQILIISGATEDVLVQGEAYLRVFGWGMPFFFLTIINRNVFQASGDAVRPMIFSLVAQVINVSLDPVFIFGLGFFPRMGIAGAALGTMVANVVSAGLAIWWVVTNRSAYRLKLKHCVPDAGVILGVYRVGLPSAVLDISESVVFAIFNHVVAGFGSTALAAVGLAGRIVDLAFMPVIGTAHGLLPIIGFSVGARLWDRLWKAVRMAAFALAAVMTAATILLEIFSPQIVGLFTRDHQLIELAVPGMRLILSTLVLIGPVIVFITTLQGLSKARDALVLSLARQSIVFIPAIFILSRLLGMTGVWISLPLSDVTAFTLTGLWMLREYRNQKKDPAWFGVPAGSIESQF